MEVRRRIFGLATGAVMVGALGVVAPVTTAVADSSPGSGVTFSSQPGVARIVAHYVVSPAGKGDESSSGSNGESRTVRRSPKNTGGSAAGKAAKVAGAGGSAGVSSDNTNGDSSGEGGTPSPSASFIGQQGSATTCSYFGQGCNPPDMALAASPKAVLQGVNTQWEVLDTSGNVQPGWPVSAQAFFGVPSVTKANGASCDTAHQSQPFLSDPRALYDAIDGRFWAAMLQLEGTQGPNGIAPDCPFKTVYYVSVSQTSNPAGKWNVYEFEMSMGQPFNADYTQLGINGQAVYFSANMFANAGNGFYAELFEANKAKMEEGQGGFTADGFFNLQGGGPGIAIAGVGPFLADTVQPAVNLDGSAGSSEVFVDTIDGPDLLNGHLCSSTADSCSGLAVWTMSNPIAHDRGGPAPTLTGTYVPTKPFAFPPPADQPSCNQCVDALDLRVTGTPVIRDGTLYAAWETALNNSTQVVPGIEWAQVNLHNPERHSSARSGYYNFSGDAAASFGTLMPDSQGNVTMVFDHMSHTVFPEIRYIRKSADGNFHGAGVLLKAGESSYRPELCGTTTIPVCRWGDFEAVSFDGRGRIWMASQYANQYHGLLTPPAFGRNWGTWIGAVDAG